MGKLLVGALTSENQAEIPAEDKLANSETVLPYVFVGDDAFSLKPYLMKPFPFRNQERDERVFSYRLSRARRIIENAFGILSSRFRIFHTTINLAPEKVEQIVLAAVVLHNYLRREHMESFGIDSLIIEEGNTGLGRERTERREMIPLERIPRRPTEDAKMIRVKFKEYFNGEGSLQWQEDMI